ncbi:MAG: NAD(P)H-dependent oxidoreductase subunit E [Actinobacteria bacterium]|nr:NAD(P)H-dependent oxidoreductase subunit E [Actinomycetota bacterium]
MTHPRPESHTPDPGFRERSIWSKETQERAARIVARYPLRRSAVMPLLYLAMREEGYLTDEGMEEVSRWCGITPAQVYAVASFYTMYKREPVGRYLISCCTSISCMLLGSDEVMHSIEESSGVPHGETDEEGLVSVEHAECIGACGGAPALQVNYELIEGVTPEKARDLVQWLRAARPEVLDGDEMQQLFGTRRSFDWAIREEEGAIGPYPAFGPLGTVGES